MRLKCDTGLFRLLYRIQKRAASLTVAVRMRWSVTLTVLAGLRSESLLHSFLEKEDHDHGSGLLAAMMPVVHTRHESATTLSPRAVFDSYVIRLTYQQTFSHTVRGAVCQRPTPARLPAHNRAHETRTTKVPRVLFLQLT